MKGFLFIIALHISTSLLAQISRDSIYILQPDRVFDGEIMHENWWVLVAGDKIAEVGPAKSFSYPRDAHLISLKGMTLLPGFIEGHSHLFLHPYNETPWDDQVLIESRAERTIRAASHARQTLMAGFTTSRDLGTEGAGYDDVGLKIAIDKKLVPGPRMLVATRAIVLKGTYGPRSPNPDVEVSKGAAEVSGGDELIREAMTQISHGADIIKVYGDYRWGTNGEVTPTFTEEELKRLTKLVKAGGREIVVHASGIEAMTRAAKAGVTTIEHGDEGNDEVFRLMKENGVAYCPTLAASESILGYGGWKKGVDEKPKRLIQKEKSFHAAMESGVTICMGGDVGVFSHGTNSREMILMVEYGMPAIDVLRAATSVNARVFGLQNQTGRIMKGLKADIIAVNGNPVEDIKKTKEISFVMKEGEIFKSPTN